MAQTQINPIVNGTEKFKITYETKKWLFFIWRVVLKSESIGKNIDIITDEKVDVYLNGIKLN